jgi:toxin ParE1/3/4
VATIQFAPEVVSDFTRILDHLERHHAEERLERIELIRDAIGVLAGSPMIGRPSDDWLRELVIGRGSRGYIALYEDDEGLDLVRVVRVWHQRERRG